MTHLRLVRDCATPPSPPSGGSLSADYRETVLIEEMTRRLVMLDQARGELFAALAHRDGDNAVAAARRLRSAAWLICDVGDMYTRPAV